MSFNNYAKSVLDAGLPLPARRALKSCIESLTCLSNESYRSARARYDARFHCLGKDTIDEQLIAALSAIVAERSLVLARLHRFEQERMYKKQSGRRTLSKAEQQQLMDIGSVTEG